MAKLDRNMPSPSVERFSMIPRSDIPRSTFSGDTAHKTTFDTGYLVPFFCVEVLPGDVWQGNLTVFARLNNLLFPMMDNLDVDTHFFFCPNRLVWPNWPKFMGEQANPGDSISYTIPQVVSNTAGWAVNSLGDYFGLGTVGQITAGLTLSTNALPLRAYNQIYNEWFRDENLQPSVAENLTDGPDSFVDYNLLRRGKKHDYFTSCLPNSQKFSSPVPFLTGQAPISGIAFGTASAPTAGTPASSRDYTNSQPSGWTGYLGTSVGGMTIRTGTTAAPTFPQLFAELNSVAGNTVNALRLAMATQQFLEKDMRSGTRYTELIRAHFGVTPQDSRLQRPEYCGGGRTMIQTSAIPQMSATGLTGGSSPLGALAAQGVLSGRHAWSYHAMEHGHIIGLVSVMSDPTYQQGLHRMWTRSTRYDFYWPTFANLGEQVVRNDEIYVTGTLAQDTAAFGYIERYGEYRWFPNRISGLFRSTAAGTIDPWHLAQKFTALPTLNSTFIQENAPVSRALAAGAAANGMQILFDSLMHLKVTRAMPMYGVPGLSRF